MDIYCILILLFISVLSCKYIFKKRIIEGLADDEEEEGGEEGEEEELTEDEVYYYELEQDNYLDEAGFDAMMRKGLCTDEPDSPFNHSCKIEDALENRPKIDLRFVNQPSSELDPSLSHTYVNLCPTTYQQNMDKLKHEKDNFFKNKLSLGQYAGYSDNAYIDRTRYATSTDPLPVNPDFFMDGGGTFA